MIIYIPSRGRAGLVTTPAALPKQLAKLCTIVVRHDEIEEYREASPDLRYLVMPKGVEGISATRQWILDKAKGKYLCMVDDDITGFCFKPLSTKYGGIRRCKASKLVPAFKLLLSWVQSGKFAHVGISERYMAARPSERPWFENNRMGQFTIWNLTLLKCLKLRFDRVPLMQDLDMNLQLLAHGYPSRVLTRVSFVAKPENYKGGCSIFRTTPFKMRACRKLANIHKGIIEVHLKEKGGEDYYFLKTKWRLALKGRS